MNDSELNKLLTSAKVPERSAEHWANFPGQVVRSLHRQRTTNVVSQSYPRPRLAWGVAFAVCLVIGFLAVHRRGANQVDGSLQNGMVVREVVAMFPNQVQAIVQDEKGIRLSLAETPNVPQSQPLWIKICEGKHCRSIVTFSGQEIQIDGQRVEVLADASGGVMLVGDHFFWSAHDKTAGRLRIDAQQLNHVL